ncbi:RidA family protein [Acidipila sp. EB88]|uniref:RidA family protein n=1 Tax=Acidipila sp. EB88 TaxID=2305226 RepID=UPI000F5D90F5|nr:RidA family protein [Acidipila sp. EB88]RRA49587.1 RidA family protein [Acidipila sp. EB88]
MEKQSRRAVLKGAAKTALAAGSAAAAMATPQVAKAQEAKPEKKNYGPGSKLKAGDPPPLFNSAISYGNLLFLAGVGAHFQGTIQEHTKHVLDEIEKNLVEAGSSMDKVLKVNVYLNDLKDYQGMNDTYKGRFGNMPPVRTTVSPAGGIPGNSLVEIDVIAYI